MRTDAGHGPIDLLMALWCDSVVPETRVFSDLYDFLDSSALFEEKHLQSDFSRMPDTELRRHVDSYRAVRLASARPAPSNSGEIAVFAKSSTVSDHLLNQCAFYVDKFYMLDPLFVASEPRTKWPSLERDVSSVNRPWIKESLLYLKRMRPLVEAGYLHLGLRENAEAPVPIPLIDSDNNFEDHVPAPVLERLRTRASVKNKIITSDGRHLVMTKPIKSRHLAVSFRGDEPVGYGFDYPEEIDPDDAERRSFYLSNALNRAAWMFYSDAQESWRLATSFNAKLITFNTLVRDVFAMSQPGEVADLAINPLADFHVPFMQGVDAATIMSVRRDDGEAFQVFREALEKRLVELAKFSDPAQLAAEQVKLVKELTEVQVRAISKKVRALILQHSLGGALAFATLAATPLHPLAFPVALGLALKQAHKDVEELRTNPCFFLWKADRAKKRAR